MLITLCLIAAYLLIGILVDAGVHLTRPIIYRDAKHALAIHVSFIFCWPYVVWASIRYRG